MPDTSVNWGGYHLEKWAGQNDGSNDLERFPLTKRAALQHVAREAMASRAGAGGNGSA
jgi:hypothetical protein